VGVVWEATGPRTPVPPGDFDLEKVLQGTTGFSACIRQSKAVGEPGSKPEAEEV
jgi:hypothetical protein